MSSKVRTTLWAAFLGAIHLLGATAPAVAQSVFAYPQYQVLPNTTVRSGILDADRLSDFSVEAYDFAGSVDTSPLQNHLSWECSLTWTGGCILGSCFWTPPESGCPCKTTAPTTTTPNGATTTSSCTAAAGLYVDQRTLLNGAGLGRFVVRYPRDSSHYELVRIEYGRLSMTDAAKGDDLNASWEVSASCSAPGSGSSPEWTLRLVGFGRKYAECSLSTYSPDAGPEVAGSTYQVRAVYRQYGIFIVHVQDEAGNTIPGFNEPHEEQRNKIQTDFTLGDVAQATLPQPTTPTGYEFVSMQTDSGCNNTPGDDLFWTTGADCNVTWRYKRVVNVNVEFQFLSNPSHTPAFDSLEATVGGSPSFGIGSNAAIRPGDNTIDAQDGAAITFEEYVRESTTGYYYRFSSLEGLDGDFDAFFTSQSTLTRNLTQNSSIRVRYERAFRLEASVAPANAEADRRYCLTTDEAWCVEQARIANGTPSNPGNPNDPVNIARQNARPMDGAEFFPQRLEATNVVVTVLRKVPDPDSTGELISSGLFVNEGSAFPSGLVTLPNEVEDDARRALLINVTGNTRITWSYNQTIQTVIGEHVVPCDPATTPCTSITPTRKPDIKVITAGSPVDTAENSFYWNEDTKMLYPLRQVPYYEIQWEPQITSETRPDPVYASSVWPQDEDAQEHVAGAPVNVDAEGSTLAFREVSYSQNGGIVTGNVFEAPTAGYSVLRFDNGTASQFIVVKSRDITAADKLTQINWNIGSPITADTAPPSCGQAHNDPEDRNGYVFYENALYDGAGQDRSYQRATRLGPIVAVNEYLTGSQAPPLVVVWYETANGIGWPVCEIRYRPIWPTATALKILSPEEPALNQARVYNQPNPQLPGYNPNEEHAFVDSGKLYTLRNDLGQRESKPYVLLKYLDGEQWAMKVYQVQDGTFSGSVVAGQPILSPLPSSIAALEASFVKDTTDDDSEHWYHRDHKGGHWAKAAGANSKIVMKWYYTMRSDFWVDLDTDGVPDFNPGDTLPLLHEGTAYRPGSLPADYTYTVAWPPISADIQLRPGDTLTTNSGKGEKLPDLVNLASAAVIFDENVYNGGGPLAKLYAPYRNLRVDVSDLLNASASATGLPADVKTEMVSGGLYAFPDLPFDLQARFFFDPAWDALVFKGVDIAADGEDPWLLPNLMTDDGRKRIRLLFADTAWRNKVDELYKMTRNPNGVSVNALERIVSSEENPFHPGETYTWSEWGVGLGAAPVDGDPRPVTLLGEKNALTAGMAQGRGWVVIAENDHPDLGSAPVALHVVRIGGNAAKGLVKVVKPKNVFDEKLTLHYAGDFGGEPEKFTFEWYSTPADGDFGLPGLPDDGPSPESCKMIDGTEKCVTWDWHDGGVGRVDTTIEGASEKTLSDNFFIVRYHYGDAWPEPLSVQPDPGDLNTNWSAWTGGPGLVPVLAEGWVKRVFDDLNLLEARVRDFRNSPTNTMVSMISQLGRRYEGPIAFNADPDNLNSIGMIEAYETVLRRAEDFSIDAERDNAAVNDALLNAATRLADFYKMLGNEAYGDALDPTIGFGTQSAAYGHVAPSIFAFQNQVGSLLDEELALLRGRDDSQTPVRADPEYNRLLWNFTRSEGELAYAQNYNVSDRDNNGVINAGDAKIMFPQGHGDAWGHYLSAAGYYYDMLGHPFYTWRPRVEFVTVAGHVTYVDYLDERKFAAIAAAKAKTGVEIMDLTYRSLYVDDPAGQWQGYKDSDSERAWGVDGWARRVAQGTFFDWTMINALLPADPAGVDRPCSVWQTSGECATGSVIEVNSIAQIDRTTVPELKAIAGHFQDVQAKMNEVDGGLNPLGLAKGVVPFDIDPSEIDQGKTHFEQVYERAEKAMDNAVRVFDYANEFTQMLRHNQDTLEDFKQNVDDQERDYMNRLIEIFGYPYSDDIGPGKTYSDGYQGPDYVHFNYVDLPGTENIPTVDFTLESQLQTGDLCQFEDDLVNRLNPLGGGSLEEDCDSGLDIPAADSAEIKNLTFTFSAEDLKPVKPEDFTGRRRAQGEIQRALVEVNVAKVALEEGLAEYEEQIGRVEIARDLAEARHNVAAEEIRIIDSAAGQSDDLDFMIRAATRVSEGMQTAIDDIEAAEECASEALPDVVGTANDPSSAAEAALCGTTSVAVKLLNVGVKIADGLAGQFEDIQAGIQEEADLKIDINSTSFEVLTFAKELEREVNALRPKQLELFVLREQLEQAHQRYLSVLAEGQRLLEERTQKRMESAAVIQEYRFDDLGFRIFRNDAVQKYRAAFDLAARYLYLAATAYDYETNLLGWEGASGRQFLTDIVRQRSLGTFVDGVPLAGQPGLGDSMARLSQNFDVLKTQLGFNNPETETTPFSLRSERYRIKKANDAGYSVDSDGNWRDTLKDAMVDDLWQIPEFRRYCRPFAPESAGAQPGIVIPFSTEVAFGKNFFGWPLSGGDSAYSTSNYSTRIRSVGVWFEDYNASGLSNTPRVYLVPTGADVLRSPSGDGSKIREWTVVDQKLPVPFPIGETDLRDPEWIPINDSIQDLAEIRRFADLRAYHFSGGFNPSEATSNSRLVGRSVWNTQWLLIIPGGTLLADPEAGLDEFIDSVSDVRLFFQTYSYSGN